MTDNPLRRYDHVVSLLTSSVRRGSAGLHSVPGLIKQIVNEDMWRQRLVEETGEIVECRTFLEFVVSPPPKGVGTDLDTLKRLCYSDPLALDALDRATVSGQGQRTDLVYPQDDTPELHNNVMMSDEDGVRQGNSRQYAVRKLRKDAPELHAKVLAGYSRHSLTEATATALVP